jgi:enamine deaminase RidA (YjgF/YER057c/UK114 family)
VALDLLAMRPARATAAKTLKEYEPSIAPLRYLIYDSVVFLSGVTAVVPDLESQVADIIPRIAESLADAGASWEKVVKTSFFLHRSQKIEDLRRFFHARVNAAIPRLEYDLVDGYSSEGKLVEIEVTATL